MNKHTLRLLVVALLSAACLAVWLFFEPLLTALGLWAKQVPAVSQAPHHVAQATHAAYFLLANGTLCMLILASAALSGGWVLCAVRGRSATAGSVRRSDTSQFVLFALGLGIAMLSTCVSLFGWAGLLSRLVLVLLLLVLPLPGVFLLVRRLRCWRADDQTANRQDRCGRLLLVIIPLATLGLLAAMVPAGVLWEHDGRGFDALEYHLQLPREYMEAGRIGRIDHNAYNNFPANAEMLYLLAMVLKPDHVEGMYLAQMLNYALAVALVGGVYVLLRSQGRTAAAVAALIIAGPQLFFVATNAYVECYMLLMFLLALGSTSVVSGSCGGFANSLSGYRRAVLAGIYAGAACGAKYTAIITIVPVVSLFVLYAPGVRLRRLLLLLATTLLLSCPWLIRNLIYRGNPVFPLATRQFGQANWTDEQVARWNRAHRPAEDATAWSRRASLLADELSHPSRYGTTVIGVISLCVIGLRRSKGPIKYACLFAVIIQIAGWLCLTHLQSRFLLPMAIPLSILAWTACMSLKTGLRRSVAMGVAIAAVVTSTCVCGIAYNRSTAPPRSRRGFAPVVGRDDLVAASYPFSDPHDRSTKTAKILLVGESRPFYVRSDYAYNTVFDRCGIAEMFSDGIAADAVVDRLRQQGFTHVYVNWSETARLQKYYDFAGSITPANFKRLEPAGLLLRRLGSEVIGPPLSSLYRIDQPR